MANVFIEVATRGFVDGRKSFDWNPTVGGLIRGRL